MNTKNAKQLSKAYNKRLKELSKEFFINNEIGLQLFVEYLRYTRDFLILSTAESIEKDNKLKVKLATIMAAIAEFDAYCSYDIKDKKTFHLDNFFEITKQNMEAWLE
jgi:hypothetical protein